MRRAPWLVLAFSLASCAANPPPPKAGPLGAWGLSEFRLDADQPAHAPSSGAPFRVILDEKGGASGVVACNHWEGRYSTSAGELFLENVAVGRERCVLPDPSTAQLAQVFLTRLESGARYQVAGNSMQLEFVDGLRWQFQRE